MASSSNSAKEPKLEKNTASPNWLDLPRDVTAKIFQKLGAIEILLSAQFVCPPWRKISMDPLLWRTVDMRNRGTRYRTNYDLDRMCRHAIDRSCGQMEEINVEVFGNDDILKYIAESKSASHVRRLRVAHGYYIYDEGFFEVAKLPLLEELEIYCCRISSDYLEVIGRNCPLLKVLKLNKKRKAFKASACNLESFAIARTMPNLRRLQLLGNELYNDGLLGILDGCPHLESLDLRGCRNLDLRSSLGKRCAKQIKELRLPRDYLDASSDEDYDYDDPYADLYCDGGLTESSDDEEAAGYLVAEYCGLL